MNIFSIILIFFSALTTQNTNSKKNLIGAWKSDEGVIIFTDGFFSYSEFSEAEFKYSKGGSWSEVDGMILCKYEYHTQDSSKIGKEESIECEIATKALTLNNQKYTKIDDGKPGQLAGAWLFNNRKRNGELGNPRSADNPRKTMKILSGSRFQWIAYNVKTKAFSGTGGGTYITKDGKYSEHIDFFSRDHSRVGASLEFEYELKGDDWHHKGFSSKGDPIYEIWKARE